MIVLIIRIEVEDTHYISPDSWHYLQVAQNIYSGKGALMPKNYPSADSEDLIFCAVWPLGYPFLIALTAMSGVFSLFWAAKLVNFIALAVVFGFLRRLDPQNAFFLALVFCAYPLLEVYSYTWSEGMFLAILLIFSRYTYLLRLREPTNYAIYWAIFFCLSALFLLRYAGLIFLIMVGGMAVFFYIYQQKKKSFYLSLVLIANSLLISLYLFNNYWQTGYLTGGVRVVLGLESNLEFWGYFGRSIFNLFFVIYYWHTNADDWAILIFCLTALVQIICLFPIMIRSSLIIKELRNQPTLSFGVWLLGIAIYYILMILLLRFWMPFDKFDYRIMSPAILTALLGFLWIIKESKIYTSQQRNQVVILFLISLFFNLPKVYLIQWLWTNLQI
jgi:hypothetical protein